MVGSCVTTMNMTNVGSCVNNIHSITCFLSAWDKIWKYTYTRSDNPSMYIRNTCLDVMNHAKNRSNCNKVYFGRDMLVNGNWDDGMCKIESNGNEYTSPPNEDVLCLWKGER